MNNDEKKKIYAALSAPFPAEAIERTRGAVTGRGYDTSGIKYQYVVNRFNEVLGVGGYRTEQTISVRQATTQKGRTVHEAICEIVLQLGEWVDGVFMPFAEVHGTGGHGSMSEADARKGAFTNGFKKAAAMLGCGKQAYEGTLDDDNLPSTFNDEVRAANDERPVAHRLSTSPSSSVGANNAERNRLSAKQLAALWAIARKLDIDKVAFRNRVKEKFGCTLEFLDKNTASALISELSAKLGNGQAHNGDVGEAA
jgi:hypothetical protein